MFSEKIMTGDDTAVASEDGERELVLKPTYRFWEVIEGMETRTGFDPKTQFQKGHSLLQVVVGAYEQGKCVYIGEPLDNPPRGTQVVSIPDYRPPIQP